MEMSQHYTGFIGENRWQEKTNSNDVKNCCRLIGSNSVEMKVHHLQNFHVLKLKVCEKCDAVFWMQREQDTQHAGDMQTALAYKERLFWKRTGRLPFISFGSLLDSAERNRQLCCNEKKNVMEKIQWRCRGSNQGLSHAKRTLYHWATSPSWKIGLLKHIYLLSHTTLLLW